MTILVLFINAFLASLAVAVILIATQHLHGRFSQDSQAGVQKIHTHAVPRIGGLALAGGQIAGGLTLTPDLSGLWLIVWLSCLPAFVFGFVEDITKRVGAKWRLMATLCGGSVFCVASGYHLTHADLPGLDWLLTFAWFAIPFTAIVIAGIANAFNIIDGVNGLSLGTAMIVFAGLAVVAAQYGDVSILVICVISLGALAGLLLVNFPFGLIFLGDAGAYAIGTAVVVTAMMLPLRHPDISPLMGLLGLSYPITEMLVSIWRRMTRKNSHPAQPDRLHLHSLIHRDLARRVACTIKAPRLRNPVAAALIWPLPLLAVTLMVLFHETSAALLAGVAVIVVIYLYVYRRVAHLKPARSHAA